VHVTLEAVGHRFRRSDGWLFRDLSVRLDPGEVYALTGPSGSGKSTLLSLIARLDRPTEGAVQHFDVSTVGWVFQNPFGSPHRSALDHVALSLLASGSTVRAAEAEAEELLARFALDGLGDRRFSDLSGGEAQRLMLARGLAAKPQLLLVDEPTAQLDRRTAELVDAAIAAVADPHTVVVVATHDPRTRDACSAHIDLAGWVPRSPE